MKGKGIIFLAIALLMNLVVMSALLGCGDLRGEDGVDGVDGSDGLDGATGAPGTVGALNCVGCIQSVHMGDSVVTTSNLAPDAVTSDKIQDGQVTSDDIMDYTIASVDLGDSVINSSNLIATGVINSSDITNFTILPEDLSAGVINSTNLIGPGVVQSADIAGGQIMNVHFGESITNVQIRNGTLTPGDMGLNVINNTNLIDTGAVTSDDIFDGTIQAVDIGTTEITGGLAGNIALNTITRDNLTLDSVGNAQMDNNAVGSAEIADGTIAGVDLGPNAVYASSVIGPGAVERNDIADTFAGTTVGGRNTLSQFWMVEGTNNATVAGSTLGTLDDMSIGARLRGGIYLVSFNGCFRIGNRPNFVNVELWVNGAVEVTQRANAPLFDTDTVGSPGNARVCVPIVWVGGLPEDLATDQTFEIRWSTGAGKNAFHDATVDDRTLSVLELTR
jgi:hypothetical protein